jgi:hypothetical protein
VTDAAIIEALRSSGGVVSVAAQLLGVAPSTIRMRTSKDPVLKAAWLEVRDEALDLAEAKLLQAIRDGDMRATMFFLKTQGRSRGYGHKVEASVTVRDHGPDVSGLSDEKLDEAVAHLIQRTGGPIEMPVPVGNREEGAK